MKTDALVQQSTMNEMLRLTLKFITVLITMMEFKSLKVSALFPVSVNINIPNIPNPFNFGTERESSMKTEDIIKQFGYPVETHTVTTPDGYILELHRIPHRIKSTAGPRTPVLVGHGLLSSSTDFVINYPHQSLGFLLADAGYDVWLCNFRGNTNGRKHETLNPNVDMEFWRFTWDQIAEFDLPEHIDYILRYTKYEQLYYIGHSMGTTVVFAMLASKPEYNKKIKLLQALAPATKITHGRSPIFLLAPLVSHLEYLFLLLGPGEFLFSNIFINLLTQHCDDVISLACTNIFFLANGFNQKELNTSRLDVYLSHFPAGSSSRTVIHFIQTYRYSRFQKFDWGSYENKIRYGQEEPPVYNLKNVKAPVNLYWSWNDLLADPRDVAELKSALPNVVEYIQVGDEYWTHTDFVLAINANKLLYEQLIKRMPRF